MGGLEFLQLLFCSLTSHRAEVKENWAKYLRVLMSSPWNYRCLWIASSDCDSRGIVVIVATTWSSILTYLLALFAAFVLTFLIRRLMQHSIYLYAHRADLDADTASYRVLIQSGENVALRANLRLTIKLPDLGS